VAQGPGPAGDLATILDVRTLFRWIVVTVGIAALVRWLRRRGEERAPVEAAEAHEDPADELRRKLAESRGTQQDAQPVVAAEPSVDERREDVHAQGRAALAEMSPSDES
jgi:hypothetical protein